jgi:serine/threonine protein kinase
MTTPAPADHDEHDDDRTFIRPQPPADAPSPVDIAPESLTELQHTPAPEAAFQATQRFEATQRFAPTQAQPSEDRTVIKPPPRPAAEHGNALPVGTWLGEFELTRVVGEGGFGIVYLAQDHSLQRRVALKEYMPSALAARTGPTTVAVKSERHRETFDLGLKSFVNEARLLAQFDHPSLVKVYRFWEANGTAYMVMPFYEGITM